MHSGTQENSTCLGDTVLIEFYIRQVELHAQCLNPRILGRINGFRKILIHSLPAPSRRPSSVGCQGASVPKQSWDQRGSVKCSSPVS